jgi:hypothetical protein
MMAVKQQGSMSNEGAKEAAECLKSECAWYVYHVQPESEGCAIAKMSNDLKGILLK